jgi:hypothetical protein
MEKIFAILLILCFNIGLFAQDHDAELLFQATNISIKNGKLLKTISYEIKINNRAGEKFTKISIPYSKLIKVSKIAAFIKDNTGAIVKKLQKDEIIDKSAISDYSLYEDNYIKEFTLKHNSYPYSICYSYDVLQEEFLSIDNWLPVLDWETPTVKALLVVEVPKGYKISNRSHLTDSFRCDSTDQFVKYIWNASYNKLIEPEISSPRIASLMPYVIIVPASFKYDLPGSLTSWPSFGEWHNNLLKGLSDLPDSEKNNIANLLKGTNDTKAKIKILYNYLQDNTRYINITIETGGLKPYPASYVAVNKYGDCKALTNYFKSVLDFAGIESFYTKVNAGGQIDEIDKTFPSQQFNHIILCVPVQKDTIWLDCTSDMPFNYLGTFSQARDVFMIQNGRSHFTRTPELTNKDVLVTRKASFSQNIQNQTIAKFSNTYKGARYESYFYLSKSVNETDRLLLFRNNIVNGGFELIDYTLAVPPRDSAKISLSYSARSNKIYKAYGKDLVIPVLPFSISRFEDPKKRKLVVQIDYPEFSIDSLEYEIPPEYVPDGRLADESFSGEFGSYRSETTITGNKVRIVKRFQLNRGIYTLDKYPGFYAFISKVIDIENNNKIVANKKF